MRETGNDGYKAKLVKKLRRMFPGCEILHTDANALQGVPDLVILFHNMYAALEVKAHAKATRQPNQEWYVDKLNDWSFAALIYPENEDEVLNDLQQAFGLAGSARPLRR